MNLQRLAQCYCSHARFVLARVLTFTFSFIIIEQSYSNHQRKDFDDFLRDRVCSIRVWRSMGGNLTKELCKHYCLRGLEPYQSPSLNAEMHSHRCMHHQTVLKEQKKQRRASTCDPARIAQQVSHMSEWALRRAQKLAVQDAQDVLLEQDVSSRSSSSEKQQQRQQKQKQQQQQQQRRSSWHGHPATPAVTSNSTPTPTLSFAASAVGKLPTSSSSSSSSNNRSRVSSSSRRRRSLPNATPAFNNTTSAASTVTSATSISSSSSSSSLSSSPEDQQQYHQSHQAVNVDQLKAWNVNLLQRMMSDQQHRRNSMTNSHTMNANANANTMNASLARSSVSSRNSNSNNINSRNISNITNSSNSSNSIIHNNSSNSLNHHRRAAGAGSEMSLHALLVAPRTVTGMLAKQSQQQKRAPKYSSAGSSSLPGAPAPTSDGAVDGSNPNDDSNSNSMPPYHSFLRRDSLCGFKQLKRK